MNSSFKSFFSSKKTWAGIIVVVLIAGYFGYKNYFTSAAPTRYVLGQASDQTIITSVSGTGQVSEDRDVNITPPVSGKLTSVNVKQGQQVKAGQVIAVVDQTNNTIALNQARASLASAQASYDNTLAGSTSQQIQLSELTVIADQQALANASTSLATVITQQSQAVANASTSLLNSTPQAYPAATNLSVGTIAISGAYTGSQQGAYNITLYTTGSGLIYQISGLETQTGQVTQTQTIPLGTKGLYMQFSGVLDSGDSWTVSIPNTRASNYISNENAYQNALATQQSSITSAQNQIETAQNKLQQDQINLQVLQQPPTNQTVESAKAQLVQAQAQLQNAQITYNNNILTAPFNGVVAQLNNQVGDQVTGSTNIAVLITNQSVVVAPLNEVDVSHVKLGDKATMTFDAVDGLTITGTVVEIDNIGTVTQGVVNYNVKVAFDTEDPRVKPGMSVNLSIITDIQADVLSVPNGAIQTQGTQNYVLVLDPSKTQTVAGQTGVTSSVLPTRVTVQTGAADDTNTQITSGSLKAGDTVVTQTIVATAAKSTAASATSALRIGGGAAGGFGGGGAVRVGGGAAGGAAAGR